jgi:phenylpropionate dioxygenase-like ring-hydroxylating dioxygenase large terminal subunit
MSEVPGAWVAVAAAADVTTTPRAVVVDGHRLAIVRLRADAPVTAYIDHCPHRLVPLSAGTVDGGRLRCAYHGWEFAGDGRCADLPSNEPGAHVPPRARIEAVPDVREDAGQIWIRADTFRPSTRPTVMLTNVEPALRRAWHPVALSAELGRAPTQVTLLGHGWAVRRTDEGFSADPAPYGLRERWGVLWLAPDEPAVDLFDDPDAEDAAYVGAWLPPSRTTAPAGFVADNFLDVAHFPFVHVGTFGAGEAKVVAPYEVIDEPGGCRSIQDQWFDNPEDPGVAAGLRPVRQRRRATYVYRAPFQLMLRLEELDAGAVKTILFFVQPETLTSTRIYTKMLLHGIGGVDRPDDDVVAREVAFEGAVLAEDLELQRHVTLMGLPLTPSTELHVRADRLGIALRRELGRFVSGR